MLTLRVGKLMTVAIALAASLPLSASLAQVKESKPPATTEKVIRQPSSTLEQRATTKVEPVYPVIAKAAHVSGAVEVQVIIDEAGKVISAQAISGHQLLRESACQAARQWKFKPMVLSGELVKVTGILTFNFVLDEDKKSERTKASAKPDSAEAYCERGEEFSKSRRFDEAIADFNEAIRLKPDYVYAFAKLGMAYIDARRYQEAETTCKQALTVQREPQRDEFDHTQVLMCLGLSEIYLVKYDEAIKAFKEVAQINPKMYDVRFYLAIAHHRKGEDKEAITFLKESVALNPDYVNAHFMLAEIYLAQNRWKEAIDSYKRCLELEAGPYEPLSHYGLGIAFLKLGDKQSAMNEYRALKKIGNQFAEQLLQEINK